MSDVKLKPCPFCGCTDVSNRDDGDFEWFECEYCAATSGYDPSPEFQAKHAAWHWNRRSHDARLIEALEKIQWRAQGPYRDTDTRDDYLRDLRHINAEATRILSQLREPTP